MPNASPLTNIKSAMTSRTIFMFTVETSTRAWVRGQWLLQNHQKERGPPRGGPFPRPAEKGVKRYQDALRNLDRTDSSPPDFFSAARARSSRRSLPRFHAATRPHSPPADP